MDSVGYFSGREYPTEGAVLMAARNGVSSFGPLWIVEADPIPAVGSTPSRSIVGLG